MKKIFVIWAGMTCLMLAACSNNDEEVSNSGNVSGEAKEVRLMTRGSDENPVGVDQVGIFMVYGAMQQSGNYINN